MRSYTVLDMHARVWVPDFPSRPGRRDMRAPARSLDPPPKEPEKEFHVIDTQIESPGHDSWNFRAHLLGRDRVIDQSNWK